MTEKEKVDVSGEIINRITTSALVTLDLEEYYTPGERVILDINPWLFQELILKEKDFREHIKSHNWIQYEGKLVAIICSADAIVPTWAYMLVANKLSGVAKSFVFGDLNVLEFSLFKEKIDGIDLEEYKDQRVVVKGCSKKPVPVSAYVYLTEKLTPIVKSIMYGEPCSTVPVYKRA
jgi:hypothetical protein